MVPMDLNIAWRIIPVSKWLTTMVSKSPKWGYSPYKWPKWLIMEVTNYLLTGMILQVVSRVSLWFFGPNHANPDSGRGWSTGQWLHQGHGPTNPGSLRVPLRHPGFFDPWNGVWNNPHTTGYFNPQKSLGTTKFFFHYSPMALGKKVVGVQRPLNKRGIIF